MVCIFKTNQRRFSWIGAAILFSTFCWVVLLGFYIASRWVLFSVIYHPPINQSTTWNNYWFVGGSFAWSRYDPANSQYPKTYRPPALSIQANQNSSRHWYWWIWSKSQYGGWYIRIPLWIPLAVLSVFGPIPLLNSKRRRIIERKRWDRGSCPSCGYPRPLDVLRCPECGTDIRSNPYLAIEGD